jgi:hypothetical protein
MTVGPTPDQGAVPAIETGFVTGLRTHLLAQVHGADAREAIAAVVATLTETALAGLALRWRGHVLD